MAVSFMFNKAGKNFPVDAFDRVRSGIVNGAGTTAIGSCNRQLLHPMIDTVAVDQFQQTGQVEATWLT